MALFVMWLRGTRWFVAVCAIGLVMFCAGQVRANASSTVLDYGAQLTPKERELLATGKSVKRKFLLDVDDVQYRAGLSYRLVHGSPLDVVSVLRSPQGMVRSIPYGVEATTIEEKNGVSRVRIRQGKAPIIGGYTVRMKWEMDDYRARFWLDPNDEHDLRDIWGWFMAREVSPGVTLIGFAIAFDLGGVGEILASKAHRWSLSTADRIAELVEERSGRKMTPAARD